MATDTMMAQMSGNAGFIAALDQSGGSTPGALRLYGIPDSAYSGDAEMFRLVHAMRVRIVTAPAFSGAKVIAAILFEATMDGEVKGRPTPAYLWEDRRVVPFVKVDKGLEAERDGVSLMRPMPELDTLLARAVKLGVFGTKMRSVINLASKAGIAAVVAQQFEVAARIASHGLMPIIEPEVSDQKPRQGRRGSHPSGGAAAKSRCLAGRPPGDAQADHSGRSGPLCGAHRPPARGTGRRTVRWLHAGRRLPAPRRQSRHDRKLLAGPCRRADACR